MDFRCDSDSPGYTNNRDIGSYNTTIFQLDVVVCQLTQLKCKIDNLRTSHSDLVLELAFGSVELRLVVCDPHKLGERLV